MLVYAYLRRCRCGCSEEPDSRQVCANPFSAALFPVRLERLTSSCRLCKVRQADFTRLMPILALDYRALNFDAFNRARDPLVGCPVLSS